MGETLLACSTPLASGAVHLIGKSFTDERGESSEIYEGGCNDALLPAFNMVQENIIRTYKAGCFRGLHYQVYPGKQAKLVNVLYGRAQFFWIDLDADPDRARVNTLCLGVGAEALYTPSNCAHGFMALENGTLFSLKMDAPIRLDLRGEISVQSDDIEIEFERPLLLAQLSDRDRKAVSFRNRRRL